MSINFKKANSKAKLSEDYIISLCEKRGYYVYSSHENKSHDFDFLCIKDNNPIPCEVKCKAKFIKFDCQGFDHKDYLTYKNIIEKTKVKKFYIFFVDDKNRDIHLLDLCKCSSGRVLTTDQWNVKEDLFIIPLSEMIKIGEIPYELAIQLTNFDQRDKKYFKEVS